MPLQLTFSMQAQQQTNWCWAAVSASVASYFNTPGPSGTPWQQCEIASAEFAPVSCCPNGSAPACNRDWYLDKALTRVNHLASPATSGAASFPYIQQQINSNCPVGVRIGWIGDGGHFVVVSGYDDTNGNQMVDVEDPIYGPSVYDYNAFCTGYQSGAGTWTDTYPVA
jgi:hypothetical protein